MSAHGHADKLSITAHVTSSLIIMKSTLHALVENRIVYTKLTKIIDT